MPEIVQLLSSRTGGNNFANWVAQSAQVPAIDSQLTTLIPVQEMLPFQRQILTREMGLSVPAGDLPLWEAIVPEDQAWRLHFAAIFHNDTPPHVFSFRFIPRAGAGNTFYQIARQQIRDNTDSPLYPSMAVNSTANNFFNQRGGERPEFFPGDAISLIGETLAVVNPVTMRFIFRYELIPLPVSQTPDTVWTSQTF